MWQTNWQKVTAKFYNYIADNIWVLAAGKNFAKGKEPHTKPTYPRWADEIKAMQDKDEGEASPKVESITHADRMDMFRGQGRLWKEVRE